MIRIVISQEALEDYASGSDGFRLSSDARFTAWLRREFSAFDPNHESALGADPPAITWEVRTRVLNG
jgi:hypothetical protein